MSDAVPNSPSFSLRGMGSLFIGGQEIRTTGEQEIDYVLTQNGVPVRINPNGTTFVGSMYAQYLLPVEGAGKPPLLFWHGGSMTGSAWESTPDGRQGWMEYFARNGWDTYNVDAAERGKSGWAPLHPAFADAPFLRTAEDCFTQFRIGARVENVEHDSLARAAYPNCRFPLKSFKTFARQIVPRWTTTDKLALDAYLELLARVGPSVIIAHSQGAAFAFRAAEKMPSLVKAIIAVEPAQGGETDGSALAGLPILLVYGDNLNLDVRWPTIRARTDEYIGKARSNGAVVEYFDLPALGIRGNSHMLMAEENNTEIANLIECWLDGMNLAITNNKNG